MRKQRGFTLIELLVVIAIIALLLSIILPSLRLAKEAGQRVVCTSNLKSLCSSWLLYAEENKGLVVSATVQEPSNGSVGWVGDTKGTLPVAQQIEGIKKGKLFAYGQNPDVYHCPTAAPNQRRSYSLSSQWHNNYEHSPRNTYHFGQTAKQMMHKTSEVKNPAGRFTIVDNIALDGDGYWAVHYVEAKWWNIPNWRHNGGTANAYVDGHAEATRWKNKKLTVEMAIKSYEVALAAGSTDAKVPDVLNVDQNTNEDLRWVQIATWGTLGY